MASGPRRRLTWRAVDVARRTASGCDAALRPRGRAPVARTARRRRGHVAGGHAITWSTWAPVWGATWQAGKWRAHGNSGPWLYVWGGNALSVYRPLIYRSESSFFVLCGTMFPHSLTYAGRVAARGALDSGGTAEIAWTRVHAISDYNTCVIWSLSKQDRTAPSSPRGVTRSVNLPRFVDAVRS